MTQVVEIERKARAVLARLVGALLAFEPGIEARIGDFLRAATDVGPMDHYKVFPPAAQAIVAALQERHGDDAMRHFLRAAIASAILQTIASERFLTLPARVAQQQSRHLLRMAADDSLAQWLSLKQDLFHKEFGLATLRLYAAGARLVDFRAGVPRSIMLKQGWKRSLPSLCLMARLGGFRPYFQLHVHTFNLDQVNEAGSEELYLCCAELYALHPQVLGMYGSSWFYDPALARVSPRLDYMRATPLANGAALLFLQEGGAAIDHALAKSATRRALYAEGKYVPRIYVLLWGKQDQMAWAHRRLAQLRSARHAADER